MNPSECSHYRQFLDSKHLRQIKSGITVEADELNPMMKDWQRAITSWALRCGRAGLFEECGLGKTVQQLVWAEHVCRHHNANALLLCPLAVQWQTKLEAEKFGIGCRVKLAESQADVQDGITITNYEKLHHFDASQFIAVVADEASILKSYVGATKRMLCDKFADTPYKLACTATPAPNDRMELGNQSEFLGIMPSNAMLARWFINDGGAVGTYRLRKHGERDFWRWMCSWSACISTPSDIGFSDDGYILPPIRVHEIVIECKPEPGMLFNVPAAISATDVHREKRRHLNERADAVAGLVNGDTDTWVIWCDTDYEADALVARIKDAIEVRGSESVKAKETKLKAFTDGQERVIITKPEIGGFGLNWQHCHKTTWFAGYSYERWYQAVRRLFRFGQKLPVDAYVIRTVNEGSIVESIQRKERQHVEMQREMAALMSDGMREELGLSLAPRKYRPGKSVLLPAWCSSKC